MLQLRYTVRRESEISTCMIQLRNTDINAMLKLRISIENRDSEISTMLQLRYIVQRIRDQYNASA